MTQLRKLELKVDKLYQQIFDNVLNDKLYIPYTQEDMSQANKVIFFYQVGRMNILQALYRISLIYQHKTEEIYLEHNLLAWESLGD